MGKSQTTAKQPVKQKTPKEMIKMLEGQLFGEKNKSRKKEIQALIKKFEVEIELERKKKIEIEKEKKNTIVRQLIPVGVDPKTVQCINFLNGNCDKGDRCPFGHLLKKEQKEGTAVPAVPKQKAICKFLIDAINSGEYSSAWVCPLPKCQNIHKLIELSENKEVEVSLEEYIELQRQTLDSSTLRPVTEVAFSEWKAKKDKEEELHAKRVAVLSGNSEWADLLNKNPEMFEDDEEAVEEIDYAERNYEDSDDSQTS